MPEWSNGTVSKTVVRATVPRVRIPLFPPSVAEALAKATSLFVVLSPNSSDLRRTQSAYRIYFRIDESNFSHSMVRCKAYQVGLL